MAELSARKPARWRVAVTQRRLAATATTWARDALDADWPTWFVAQAAWAQFLPLPNFEDPGQALRYMQAWSIDALILSGGEDFGSSPVRDAMETRLLDHAREHRLPVLGVCRGMQVLQRHSGGELVQISGHVGQAHALKTVRPCPPVNSWHRWSIAAPAQGWSVLARAEDGTIETMQHLDLPWLGLMWHPERSEGGSALIEPWLRQIFPSSGDQGPDPNDPEPSP